MKDDLLNLIEEIQRRTGLNMGEISVKAGYGPNYLSEVISKNKVNKKVLSKVRLAYDLESTFIKDAASSIIELVILDLATSRVALRILAEQQAPVLKLPATEVANIYQRMVRDEAEAVRGELRRK